MAAEREKSPPTGERKSGFRAWLTRRHDPLTSLVLTIPVFLVYHLGILAMNLRNGVDLVSSLTFELLNQSLAAYVAVTIGIAAGISLTAYVLRRKGKIQPAEWLPVLGESVVLAIAMMLLVGWATNHLFDWQIGPRTLNPLEKIVMACGAGFHEELVFRAGLFGGGTFLLTKLAKWPAGRSAVLMAILSSAIFSAIHYVGSLGDTFTIVSFAFRMLSGLYLCAIYRWRGFAVAVYTHAIYDVIVFFFIQR